MLMHNAISAELLQGKSCICNVHAFVICSCFGDKYEHACLDDVFPMYRCHHMLLRSFYACVSAMICLLPWMNNMELVMKHA